MTTVPSVETTIERDLGRLAGDRVEHALMSVTQLTDSPRQTFIVAVSGHAAAAGILAAAYCDMTGAARDSVDPFELAIAILRTLQVKKQAGK